MWIFPSRFTRKTKRPPRNSVHASIPFSRAITYPLFSFMLYYTISDLMRKSFYLFSFFFLHGAIAWCSIEHLKRFALTKKSCVLFIWTLARLRPKKPFEAFLCNSLKHNDLRRNRGASRITRWYWTTYDDFHAKSSCVSHWCWTTYGVLLMGKRCSIEHWCKCGVFIWTAQAVYFN